MRFFNSHFNSVVGDTGEKALLFGIAGGRVKYYPYAKYLYSIRFFFLWFKYEILWTTGEHDACEECETIPVYADDSSQSWQSQQQGAEPSSSKRVYQSDTGE